MGHIQYKLGQTAFIGDLWYCINCVCQYNVHWQLRSGSEHINIKDPKLFIVYFIAEDLNHNS